MEGMFELNKRLNGRSSRIDGLKKKSFEPLGNPQFIALTRKKRTLH